MNKKLSAVVVLSMLFSCAQIKPISHEAALVVTALMAPVYYYGLNKVSNNLQEWRFIDEDGPTARHGSRVGAVGLTVGTYGILYRLTPHGRYMRAYNIVENTKKKLSLVLEGAGKDSINFMYLDCIKEVDSVSKGLKKAESLLVAAKKDIAPSLFESCKVSAQNLYSKQAGIFETKNHKELDLKIDSLLVQVRAMISQIAEIYGSEQFMQQLKNYEDLRSQRAKTAALRFAVPMTTVLASLVVVGGVVAKLYGAYSPAPVIQLGRR